MARFAIPVFCALMLASCGGGEENGDTSVSLDLPDDGGATADPGTETIPPTPGPQPETGGEAPPQLEPSFEQQPDSDPVGATASNLLKLDDWHRAIGDARGGVLADAGAAERALRDFAQIWEGNAAAYRSRLQTRPVTAFGAEFEACGKAFAKDGLTGLKRSLDRGSKAGPAYLAWTDALAEIALNEDDYAAAGAAVGTLLPAMLSAGYDRMRVLEFDGKVAALAARVAAYLPAEDYVAQPNDSYWAICRKFRKQGVHAYRGWIADFNGKRNYNVREGEKLRIPTASLKLVAWRQARIAALLADGSPIRLYPISVGTEDEPTPLGDFTLAVFLEEPMWYPLGESPVPFGHPDNPLGERWMAFEEDKSYGFHGTNSEETIGGFESRGCIRMHNEDVVELFEMVGPGVPVTIAP